VHPRPDAAEGALNIDVAGFFARYVCEDRFEEVHEFDAMDISFDPTSCLLGFASRSFSRDVARDALPLVGTEVGGTLLGIRHIH